GCTDLASLHERGEGVPQNYLRARELYERGCEAGSATGCNNLGYLLHQGLGGPRDLVRARALYQRACDAGNTTACNNVRVIDGT
ncbi:MAG: sel1 repeat family protein, partial [Sandaracinaceae bacterium]|nr:sel1 repeat family protein [Sandaracinaceae bacterium]